MAVCCSSTQVSLRVVFIFLVRPKKDSFLQVQMSGVQCVRSCCLEGLNTTKIMYSCTSLIGHSTGLFSVGMPGLAPAHPTPGALLGPSTRDKIRLKATITCHMDDECYQASCMRMSWTAGWLVTFSVLRSNRECSPTRGANLLHTSMLHPYVVTRRCHAPTHVG